MIANKVAILMPTSADKERLHFSSIYTIKKYMRNSLAKMDNINLQHLQHTIFYMPSAVKSDSSNVIDRLQ